MTTITYITLRGTVKTITVEQRTPCSYIDRKHNRNILCHSEGEFIYAVSFKDGRMRRLGTATEVQH